MYAQNYGKNALLYLGEMLKPNVFLAYKHKAYYRDSMPPMLVVKGKTTRCIIYPEPKGQEMEYGAECYTLQ